MLRKYKPQRPTSATKLQTAQKCLATPETVRTLDERRTE
jgi:hypothetical protein